MLVASAAAAAVPPATTAQALEILGSSIRFRTFPGQDQVPAYAEYLAGVLRGSDPSLNPIVLAAHMDVVPALAGDWQRDPFVPVTEGGFVFGRGSSDNKFGIATMVATLLWLKSEHFQPGRDIVLALTGDEETTQASTAMLAQQLRDAELVLNSDAGGGMLGEDGTPLVYGVQAAEKTYADFQITFRSPGGHSSRPGPGNPIHALAGAIGRLAAWRFPPQQSELTREYFRAVGAMTPGEVGAAMRRYAGDPTDAAAIEYLSGQPEFVGQLGTTCVATMVQAGHAANALPQSATATVNCRIFPGVSIDNVLAALRRAIDLRHPGLPIVANMSAGATDSLYYRNLGVPSYGVSGLFMKPSDDFAHGLDERVPVDSIEGALLQWRSLLRDLAR